MAEENFVKLPLDECHWTLLTLSQYCYMQWLGAVEGASHCLNPCWPVSPTPCGVIKSQWTKSFCAWPYIIYYVHNPSWEYHSKTWGVELSSLRGRYSVLYFLPTWCISINGDSNILSWGLYEGYKDVDDQQSFETKWWQNRTDCDHHS